MRHLTLILCLALASAYCHADKQPPETVTVTGILAIVQGADAALNTYTLTTDEGKVYALHADAQQYKELKPLVGRSLHVTGIVHMDGPRTWLSVQTFSPVSSDDALYHTVVMTAPAAP